jgi:hypothetical protein
MSTFVDQLKRLKENNQLFIYLFNYLNEQDLDIFKIKKWFDSSNERSLSQDSLIIEPLSHETIKSVLVLFDLNDLSKIKSLLIEPKSNNLCLKDFVDFFKEYKVYEKSRWEISYELKFDDFSKKKINTIILYTLPLELTKNIFALLEKKPFWLKTIEFRFSK